VMNGPIALVPDFHFQLGVHAVHDGHLPKVQARGFREGAPAHGKALHLLPGENSCIYNYNTGVVCRRLVLQSM
jgi:hypothetical protein